MTVPTPLRVKLVAVVVLLAALGLALSAAVSTAALKGYLQARVDDQLVGFIGDRIPIGGNDGRGPRGDRFNSVYFRYTSPSTGTLTEVVPVGLTAPDLTDRTITSEPMTVGSGDDGPAWRVIGAQDPSGNQVVLGLSLQDVQSTTRRLVVLQTVIGGLALLILAGGGYLVVRRSLRPLVEVEETAELIAAGDLSRRVPESDPRTEVGSLSRSFNLMLEQVETAFRSREESEAAARASEERMRRFVGDASHELRTPLTSIRGFAELYRQGALTKKPEVERAMSRIEGEAGRMGLLVDDLLLLARLDQQRPLERVAVDLLAVCSDAVHDAAAAAPDRSVRLVGDGAPVVQGDPARLKQVVSNLVGNALAHTDSDVDVRVRADHFQAVVDVVDHGPGIAAEDRARVFERFFRADSSRTRASGGSGLGLSIVAALVAAHGGTVEALETVGGGATFRVTLPL